LGSPLKIGGKGGGVARQGLPLFPPQ